MGNRKLNILLKKYPILYGKHLILIFIRIMNLAKILQVNGKIWWYTLKVRLPFPDTSCSLVPDTWLGSCSRWHHSSKLILEHFQCYRPHRDNCKTRGNWKSFTYIFSMKKKVCYINVMFTCPSAQRSELAAVWSDVIHLWLSPEL